MDTRLRKGDTVRLDGQLGTYHIQSVYGRGSSCVVYRADFINGKGETLDCLLKEFNPRWLPMKRDALNRLSTVREDRFQEGLTRFERGYEIQRILYQKSETRNQTAIPFGLFTGNGTVYTATELKSGTSYANVQDASIQETLETLIALTKVIKQYHDAGYLHLDIKPANMFLLPETRDMLLLFDFDSVVRKDQIADSPLSYTQDWAAPELLIPGEKRHICEASDLFSIGEILFQRIMGRHSEPFERRSFSVYDFKESVLLSNPDNLFCRKLTEFFRSTLCSYAKCRWQTAQEVLLTLAELKTLAERKFILRSSSGCTPKAYFIGRDAELQEIQEALKLNPTLFLCGMGGIGKSELVKTFAQRALQAGEYDVVLFAAFAGSWSAMIANDGAIFIDHVKRMGTELSLDYALRKLERMKGLCGSRVLFIIDNLNQEQFEIEDQPIWEQLQGLGCALLITSRLNVWKDLGKNTLPIGALEFTSAMQLFQHWCGSMLDSRQETAVKRIISLLGGHPLATEILAKHMAASDDMPADICKKLNICGLREIRAEPVRLEKDGQQLYQPGFDLIKAVLRISELTSRQMKILQAAALFPAEGVHRSELKTLCRLENNSDVNRLCDCGWLSIQNKVVTIHPLIVDVVLSEGLEWDMADRFYRELMAGIFDPAAEISEGPFDEEFSRYYIAERYAKEAFEKIRRYAGNDHPSATCAKQHLGQLYLNWGKHSLDIYEYDYASRCLLDAETLLDGSVSLYIPLGDVFYEMRSQGLDAREEPEYHQRAIAYYKKALAVPGHPASAEQRITILDQLGKLHMELFQCDEAESCLKEAIALGTQQYEEAHEKTAECWFDLAELYARYGNTEIAAKVFRKAMEAYSSLGDSGMADYIRSRLERLRRGPKQ